MLISEIKKFIIEGKTIEISALQLKNSKNSTPEFFVHARVLNDYRHPIQSIERFFPMNNKDSALKKIKGVTLNDAEKIIQDNTKCCGDFEDKLAHSLMNVDKHEASKIDEVKLNLSKNRHWRQ